MISKIVCWFKGHKRGQRVKDRSIEAPGFRHYECPRCGGRWSRKT